MLNNAHPPPWAGALVHIEYQGNKITIGSGMTILIAMALSNWNLSSTIAHISSFLTGLH